LDFSEPASCRASHEFSGEALLWDDFVPTDVCFSGHGAPGHEENIWSGESDEDIIVDDNEPYSTSQMHSPQGSRSTISDKSLISQLTCDSRVHGEDENQLRSTDMSLLPAPEWPTRMVLSCLFVHSFANTYHYSQQKHSCPPCCEIFTAPDHDLDTQSDFCIFDNDMDAMLLAFD
jgi:hypothetical protein